MKVFEPWTSSEMNQNKLKNKNKNAKQDCVLIVYYEIMTYTSQII